MKIGTYYYPDQWPRHQWERDFDAMAKMGLQIVHMGEFAWFLMEPEEGKIRLDWLAECVEMAGSRGMDVILCTPTAAPPVWLSERYPETLLRGPDGRVARHGGRRHYSPTSPALHEATRRIVGAMAERFAGDKRVIGWQIDNELSGWGYFGQNDHTHAAFGRWLKEKYGTIERLNDAWGNQFWNAFYTAFEQIRMPYGRDPQYQNPHHHLDASRFWSFAYAGYSRLQAGILRGAIDAAGGGGPRPWVTTNFMPWHLDVNADEFADHLDMMTWDSYPVGGREKSPVGDNYRLGDPNSIGMYHDYMRSFGRWGLMELQPGQVNWSGTPVRLRPGTVALWLWSAFAHGAEFVTTYRFRQPLWGIELFHHGLMRTDGVTPSQGGRDFATVIGEMKRLKSAKPSAAAKKSAAAGEIGMLLDHEQLWWMATLPQAARWSQVGLWHSYYAAACRLGLRVRILRRGQAIPAGLAALIVAGHQMADEAEVAAWRAYAEGGGHLLLTCRTALMTRSGQLHEGPLAMPIVGLIGAGIDEYDGLPDGRVGKVRFAGKLHEWHAWGDQLVAAKGTKVVGTYASEFYAGSAAITLRKAGRGSVMYVGVNGSDSLQSAAVADLAKRAGLRVRSVPARTQLLEREGASVFLNYTDGVVRTPAPRGAGFVVGGTKTAANGVSVWV